MVCRAQLSNGTDFWRCRLNRRRTESREQRAENRQNRNVVARNALCNRGRHCCRQNDSYLVDVRPIYRRAGRPTRGRCVTLLRPQLSHRQASARERGRWADAEKCAPAFAILLPFAWRFYFRCALATAAFQLYLIVHYLYSTAAAAAVAACKLN